MSGTGRATTVEAREARATLILDAAAELLGQLGLNKVTIDDVAEKAGIGKGTVYLHWKTRDLLVYAVILREFLKTAEGLRHAILDDPMEAMLSRATRFRYVAAVRNPLMRAVLAGGLQGFGRLVSGARAGNDANLELIPGDFIGLYRKRGLLRDDMSVEKIYEGVYATYVGFLLTGTATGATSNSEALARGDLLAATLHGAFERETSPRVMTGLRPQALRLVDQSIRTCRELLLGSQRVPTAQMAGDDDSNEGVEQ